MRWNGCCRVSPQPKPVVQRQAGTVPFDELVHARVHVRDAELPLLEVGLAAAMETAWFLVLMPGEQIRGADDQVIG